MQHSGSSSLNPFHPGHLHRGFSALSLGFPLAVYLFIGWKNSGRRRPRRPTPRARRARGGVLEHLADRGAVRVSVQWTVVGSDNNPDKRAAASVLMVDAGAGVSSFLAFLAYMPASPRAFPA
jgi:hypothetical protein